MNGNSEALGSSRHGGPVIPSLAFHLLRAWTRYFPIARGKSRVSAAALRLAARLPAARVADSSDGRRFLIDIREPLYRDLYFRGVFEPEETAVLRRILRPADIVLDIGASFGWYTTPFSRLVGPAGRVHSFEPLPPAFEALKNNLELAGQPANVEIHQVALGESRGVAMVHRFPDLPIGHASLCSLGRQNYEEYPCDTISLDEYLGSRDVRQVAVAKCNVEGAELAVFRGSRALLASGRPPLWMLEVNPETSQAFGYTPNDLLGFLKKEAAYSFYLIGRHGLSLLPVDFRFDRPRNVICAVPHLHQERLRSLLV